MIIQGIFFMGFYFFIKKIMGLMYLGKGDGGDSIYVIRELKASE